MDSRLKSLERRIAQWGQENLDRSISRLYCDCKPATRWRALKNRLQTGVTGALCEWFDAFRDEVFGQTAVVDSAELPSVLRDRIVGIPALPDAPSTDEGVLHGKLKTLSAWCTEVRRDGPDEDIETFLQRVAWFLVDCDDEEFGEA